MKTNQAIVGIIFLVGVVIVGLRFCSKQVIRSHAGTSKGEVITVIDKQIINTTSGDADNVKTDHDYVIFTDKGAYLVEDDWNVMRNYGGLIVGHQYEIFTLPALDFQYQGYIVTFKQK